jgi:hypothetical protein
LRYCIEQPHLAQTYPVSVTRGLFINNQTLPTHSPPQAEEDDIAGVVPAVCASVSVSGQGALFVFGRRPCHLYLQQLYKDPNQSMTLLVMHGSQPHRSIMPVRAISAPGAPVLLYHHRFTFFSHTKALLRYGTVVDPWTDKSAQGHSQAAVWLCATVHAVKFENSKWRASYF